jgi:hypothetical protein
MAEACASKHLQSETKDWERQHFPTGLLTEASTRLAPAQNNIAGVGGKSNLRAPQILMLRRTIFVRLAFKATQSFGFSG